MSDYTVTAEEAKAAAEAKAASATVNVTPKAKPWFRKFKLMVGLGTVALDAATILVSQLVADPGTQALIIKMLPLITATGLSVITGHSITNAAYALKKK